MISNPWVPSNFGEYVIALLVLFVILSLLVLLTVTCLDRLNAFFDRIRFGKPGKRIDQ